MGNATRAMRISCEYFPPKTEDGKHKLLAAHDKLQALRPEFFSVTYGAGGSTRSNTRDMVLELEHRGSCVAPHLSFGGDDEAQVLELLQVYRDNGIRRLVALRGDMPSGMGGMSQLVYAAELVEFVRRHSGAHFTIEVAAYPEVHPQARDMASDVRFLKRKFDAGADNGLTQFFYNADAYFWFIERCRAAGITQPIYPGIMPILNYQNLARFARNCGAEIPRWLHYRLESLEADATGSREFAEEFVASLCRRLLDGGAPGLHFYTMNRSPATREIHANLGL